MSTYDNIYSLAFGENWVDENVTLKPDRKTVKQLSSSSVLEPGRPLFFTNAAPEYIPDGKSERITDVMFGMDSFVVNENIKDYIIGFKIDSLQLYPAVYIDLEGKYHENLWYLNFYAEFDCWDRQESTYKMRGDDPNEPVKMKEFVFSDELIENIPEERRLMFMIGGVSRPYIAIHKKIADFLNEIEATGIHTIQVSKFKYGMQNYEPEAL